MKKKIAAAVLAAMTLTTVSAFAAPIEFSGDAQILSQKSKDSDTFTDVRLRLNADAQLGDGMYAHGRLMGIDMSPNNYGSAGTGSSGASVNMEQLYLGSKIGQVDVKIGRQPLLVGQGMIADVNGIQGVSLATSADNLTVSGFVGRSNEDNDPSSAVSMVARDTMALDLGTSVSGINLGLGYMKTEQAGTENKYLSFSAAGKIASNVALNGAYVKNDNGDKKGYIVKATFGEVAKKGDFNYALSYRNIEAGAVDADWVTNGAYVNSKGFRVAANYKVTDNGTLSIYQDITKQQNNDTVKPNQFRAEFNVNF